MTTLPLCIEDCLDCYFNYNVYVHVPLGLFCVHLTLVTN